MALLSDLVDSVSLASRFAWVAVGSTAHAFTGRHSFCGKVKLPRRWLHLGREGAVCLACSRALRAREELRKLVR